MCTTLDCGTTYSPGARGIPWELSAEIVRLAPALLQKLSLPEDAVTVAASETCLVVYHVVSSDLFHLVDSLSTLEARSIVLDQQPLTQ